METSLQILKKTPIYRYGDGKEVCYDDIVEVLRKCGLAEGNTMIVHVDLGAFGKLGDITSRREFVDIFVKAFQEVLGLEGTIVTPTFTYSFCNGEMYDPEKTPSAVGPFSEEFRLRHDACRTVNPIFSVAAIGKLAKEITTGLSKSCFGLGSVYDRLFHIENSKYVIVGVDPFICTHVHYVEELQQVSYRYIKKFRGRICVEGAEYDDEYEFYVRHLDMNVNTTFDKIEKHILKHGFMKKFALGRSFVSVVGIRPICEEGIKLLEQDPYIFLENRPYRSEGMHRHSKVGR